MGWDAEFVAGCGHRSAAFSYTHNTNRMIDATFAAADEEHRPWWTAIDGYNGRDVLARTVAELERAPNLYRKMNPTNGWGDYDTLLGVLREMLAVALSDGDGYWKVWG